VLIILLVVGLLGGFAYPRPADGPATVNTLLYVLAVVVLIILVLRLLAVV
jgi:hypothetical protein